MVPDRRRRFDPGRSPGDGFFHFFGRGRRGVGGLLGFDQPLDLLFDGLGLGEREAGVADQEGVSGPGVLVNRDPGAALVPGPGAGDQDPGPLLEQGQDVAEVDVLRPLGADVLLEQALGQVLADRLPLLDGGVEPLEGGAPVGISGPERAASRLFSRKQRSQ